MDKNDINEELKRIADSSVFSAHISEMWPNSSVFIAGRVKLDQLRDLVVLMERLQSDKHMLTVKGHPKEEFDTLLRRVGARVPLDDGMYNLTLAFAASATGYIVTDAALSRVPVLLPVPQTQSWTPAAPTMVDRIRLAALDFRKVHNRYPTTLELGEAEYAQLRLAVPHSSKIDFPGLSVKVDDTLHDRCVLTIVRAKSPSSFRLV